jgi:3-dehydroquinate synthase
MNPPRNLSFNFGGLPQDIRIGGFPALRDILAALESLGALEDARAGLPFLIICDDHTLPLARRINAGGPFAVLRPGEANKNWAAVEGILRSAGEAGLGRDCLFIACGGGVVSDLAGFAASIYMRGVGLVTVSTSLLGMVDAAMGGKTGFDLFGIKNLAGTFYPARLVYLPPESLESLPAEEWKSGFAELIKTAVLEGDDFFSLLEGGTGSPASLPRETLEEAIYRAAAYKGRIVAEDPRERGGQRALLNLGHSFAHALESSAGLGRLSHGEAVAWGMARSCELGLALGRTPPDRADRIKNLLRACGYEISTPHPLMGDMGKFIEALGKDKKNRGGKGVFIVPAARGAEILREVPAELPRRIVQGQGSGKP